MHKSIYRKPASAVIAAMAAVLMSGMLQSASADDGSVHHKYSSGLLYVDYRSLNGKRDGVALIDLDPESAAFGKILQKHSIGKGVLPHHLYFNRDESRLYTTAIGSGASLYQIGRAGPLPIMGRIKPVDTGGNIVGEDMYFTEDGSRFYMTFMGGQGGEQGGSIGVFDAHTNALLETIQAPVPDGQPSEEPFLLWPHGISANEELGLLMVTSTISPDLSSGVGNTATLIDINSHQLLKTYLVADDANDPSSPVEVILLRDGLPPYALITTMLGGDIWMAAYNENTGIFDDFEKTFDGSDHGLGWALEFYIHETHDGVRELYVSFADPGVINVYSLDDLPQLTLKRQLPADTGAHHMTFFETASHREVVAVQNNLLNLPSLNSGVISVIDIHTGEVITELDMPAAFGLMPESIESAFGHGSDLHH